MVPKKKPRGPGMPGGKPENLKPPASAEQARAMGSKGGKRSAEVRKERKLISQAYAEIIAKMNGIDGLNGVTLESVTEAILERKDSASVSMLKELREATEGSKLALVGEDGAPAVKFEFVDPPGKPAAE